MESNIGLTNLIGNLHEVPPESYYLFKFLFNILAVQADGSFRFFVFTGNRVCRHTLLQVPSQKQIHFLILKRRFVYVLPTSVCRYYCPQLHKQKYKRKLDDTPSTAPLITPHSLEHVIFLGPTIWDGSALLTAKYIITNVKVHLKLKAKRYNQIKLSSRSTNKTRITWIEA